MIEQLKSRRSLFPPQFKQGATIPKADVEQLLEAANWAPNHGQTEPWRFRVYHGAAREMLGEALAKSYQAFEGEQAKTAKTEKLRQLPAQSSHVIALIGDFGTNPKIPKWEEVAALAMAVQNIYLAAQSLGYGGYWSSPKLIQEPGLATFLCLQENEECLGFFYLGVPNQDLPLPARKRKSTGPKKQAGFRNSAEQGDWIKAVFIVLTTKYF